MSNFKGTQGHWKMVHSKSKPSYNVIGTKLGGRYKISRSEYVVNSNLSEEWNNKEMDEQKSNALLISKAPEMLEMLIHCMSLMEDASRYYKSTTLNKAIKDTEQLIKEATEL